MKDILLGQLRHFLTTLGGATGAVGFIDGETWLVIVGAIVTAAGAFLSAMEKLIKKKLQSIGPGPTAAILLCLILASCAPRMEGEPPKLSDTAVKLLITQCNAYKASLETLTNMKAMGQLSADTIKAIDASTPIAGDFCDPTKPLPSDPTTAAAAVASASAKLTLILSQVKP